jgi:hypothetical protein
LPLYEVKSGGVIEDKRPPISLSDEVLKDSAFIANIINEINNIDQIIQQFETDGLPTAHLTEKHYCAEVITP